MLKCEYGKLMNNATTFKIGGPVFCFVEAVTYKALLEAIDIAKKEDKDIKVIGNGSNILFSDAGFDGIVVKLGDDFNYIERHGDSLKVGSAVLMSKLIAQCKDLTLTGCEFLLGIPGSFGGAVFMNAGVRDTGGEKGRIEIKDIIEEVEVLDLNNKKRKILKKDDIPFKYRSSGLSEKIVLSAKIGLDPGSEKEIDDKINTFRERRIWMNKLFYPSAGSVFKNPDSGESAGSLIEDCGLKGYSIGDALISEEHANFIVNRGNASSKDVLELIELAKKSVKEKFNIDLELELKII
ncbi:MAG: UDP-N-acetylmuramate dehydrogenase [Candidatus Omnitrophota bacterium]